ncbi:ABC transporter ATP-binding protein [Clostridium sp. Cult2]|uniref:ABC transporter ATP-binding protein n=1 Tax=Clostridium sp. Cult2 TaxID=2079003 RepID=UPI001F486CE7|nr:ABC transporter ATP-binding protein [Clostridium sp. Cult2]MCF6464624.1 peptide ABC transporter ATP-binding protein [Clostridium sp. Cult2]
MTKLLEVKNLKTYFYTDDGVVKAIDGVDFSVEAGKTIGIVGESGCGKSITAMSILRLIPDPPGKIVDGEAIFEGEDLTKVSEKRIREIRGNNISMIFQEPMTSLNPVFTIGYQIGEVLMLHQKLTEEEAKERAVEMIKLVGIPNADRIVEEYPHQLSGGMRQRVMIAMALACQPKLLIADEPTTALDVTIQAQILEIMNELKRKLNTSIMLITHDLGVIAEMADHVIVMYSGKVVEDAPITELFKNPRHPYTIGLMASIPSLVKEGQRLDTIPGAVPNPLYLPRGCYFHPRCKYAIDECRKVQPELREVAPGHKAACIRAEEVTK